MNKKKLDTSKKAKPKLLTLAEVLGPHQECMKYGKVTIKHGKLTYCSCSDFKKSKSNQNI